MFTYLNNLISNTKYYWNNIKAWYHHGSFRYFVSLDWYQYGFDLFTNPTTQIKALFDAIHDNDYIQVKRLLDLGVDPNITISEKELGFYRISQGAHPTPLMVAVLWQRDGNESIIKLLLEKAANPNYRDNEPSYKNNNSDLIFSPLEIALNKQNLAVIKLLLKHGGVVNGVLRYAFSKYTYIEDAVIYSSADIVKVLLKHDAAICTLNRSGNSLLYQAIEMGDIEKIKLLVEYDAEINPNLQQEIDRLNNASDEIKNIVNQKNKLVEARNVRDEEAKAANNYFNATVEFARYTPKSLPLEIGKIIAEYTDTEKRLSKDAKDRIFTLASSTHSEIVKQCDGKFLKTILEDTPQTTYQEGIIRTNKPVEASL
jgi:hypothetical protein